MALNLDYVARETGTNLFRNIGLTVASMLTIAVSLILVGTSILIRQGVNNATQQWQGDIELIIFMEPDARGEQIDAVGASLNDNPEVENVTFFDKEAALEEYRELNQESSAMLGVVEDEPEILPTSYRVAPVNPSIQAVRGLRQQYVDEAGVLNVISADETIRAIQGLSDFMTALVTLAALVLGITAAVLIFNTIRIAMFARRREIEVMKLVGATNWFIRIPFMLEGLIQGLVGSLVALGSLFFLNNLFSDQLQQDGLNLLADLAVPSADVMGWAVVLLAAGVVISVLFSAAAASLYLDV